MNVKEEEAAIKRFFQNLNITTTMIDLLKDNNLIKLQTELRKKCLTTIAVYNRLIPYATKTIRTIEKIIEMITAWLKQINAALVKMQQNLE